MEKTCVFVTGTNCTGKSTLARALIARFGGTAECDGRITFCREGGVSLAGRYREGGRFGGVDGLRGPKGSSGTSGLAEVVERALRRADVIFCEGSYMNTFGLNLTNAMFKARRHLVVVLYADASTIASRLVARAGRLKGGFAQTLNKQRQCLVAARKWASIGVRVVMFDTANEAVPDIVRRTLEVLGLEGAR